MLTDKQRATAREVFLTRIARLMAPGVDISAADRERLIQKRDAFGINEQRVPGTSETNWIARLMVNAGLQVRRKNWSTLAPPKAADYHPEVTAPACLQGSRKPTPMPAWLVSGQGLPLKPPTRRAVGA